MSRLGKIVLQILVLVLIAVLAVYSFISESASISNYEKERDDYYRRKENAVTVVAVYEQSFTGVDEKVNWNMGAGDDVNKEVEKTVYSTNKYTYTYNGKEYSYAVRTASTVRLPEGTTMDLLIDPNDPETVFEDYYPESRPDRIYTWVFSILFFAVLVLWVILAFVQRKE